MDHIAKTQHELLPPQTGGVHPNDEIDLVQLWLILLNRKFLIVGIFGLCLVGGTAFAFLLPAKYTYTTSLEIGTTLASNGTGIVSRAIETPDSVLAKLNESYIPLAVGQMAESDRGLFSGVQAKNPKESNLIVLSSKGTLEVADSLRALHTLVIKPLIEDHRRILETPRRGYQITAAQETIKLKTLEDPRIYMIDEKDLSIQLDAAKMKLVDLDDQKKLLLSQEKRLIETQELLRQQIGKVERNLAQAQANWPKASTHVGSSGSQAMTLLMISNQIEQNERRLSELQERLNIGLENQKQVLQKDVAGNRRAWDLQKEQIAKLQSQLVTLKVKRESSQETQKNVVTSIENKLTDLQETRVLGFAVRSVTPSGPGKTVVLALSGILGLMGGVILAFISEFVVTACRRME